MIDETLQQMQIELQKSKHELDVIKLREFSIKIENELQDMRLKLRVMMQELNQKKSSITMLQREIEFTKLRGRRAYNDFVNTEYQNSVSSLEVKQKAIIAETENKLMGMKKYLNDVIYWFDVTSRQRGDVIGVLNDLNKEGNAKGIFKFKKGFDF